MSCKLAKAERSKAKDARQQPALDKPSTGTRRKKRADGPWILEEKYTPTGNDSFMDQLFGDRDEWRKVRGYAKEPDAVAVCNKRKSEILAECFDYRVRYINQP